MIRVGFICKHSKDWMGGINYYNNLLYAISILADRKIEPVVFMGKKADADLKAMFAQHATIVESEVLDRNNIFYWLWRIIYKLFDSHWFIEQFLKKYNIDVWSHSNIINARSAKTIEWIPDFQHLHLPQMFSAKEINQRNKKLTTIAKKSDVILLSSHDALKDYCAMFPDDTKKARVLQFVSQPDPRYFELTDADEKYLLKQYGIRKPYFYLPNQFWKHKNHQVAFEAINILKQEGVEVTLVCTGYMQDYRHIEHMSELTSYLKNNDLDKNIKLLGLIPYKDVFTLIRFCEMVINPSLFEGWSSTVEECKSVGKMMILSDLNVHKEQFPKAIFFERENAADLASKLKAIIQGESESDYSFSYDLEMQTQMFAQTYQNIVLECLSSVDDKLLDH